MPPISSGTHWVCMWVFKMNALNVMNTHSHTSTGTCSRLSVKTLIAVIELKTPHVLDMNIIMFFYIIMSLSSHLKCVPAMWQFVWGKANLRKSMTRTKKKTPINSRILAFQMNNKVRETWKTQIIYSIGYEQDRNWDILDKLVPSWYSRAENKLQFVIVFPQTNKFSLIIERCGGKMWIVQTRTQVGHLKISSPQRQMCSTSTTKKLQKTNNPLD